MPCDRYGASGLREELFGRVTAPTTGQCDALCSRRLEAGNRSPELAVGLSTVSPWSARFEEKALGSMTCRGKAASPAWTPSKVSTDTTRPPQASKAWRTPTMAAAAGMSRHTVHSIWNKNDLQPHLVRPFKISSGPALQGEILGHLRSVREASG